jgi:hypothetical protein
MIGIVTVNYNSYDFLWLLMESLDRYSTLEYKLIVIDNSDPQSRLKFDYPNTHQFVLPENVGHGKGLNLGVAKADEICKRYPYMMFLDVDCHILNYGWEKLFIEQMKKFDLFGGKGVASKPIRPACMFMKRELSKYDWEPSEGFKGNRVTPGGYDVGIKAYYKIMADGLNIGFLQSSENRYGTLNGEEWNIEGTPVVYHHWHGSHLEARQEDFPDVNLLEDKAKLFQKIPWRLP